MTRRRIPDRFVIVLAIAASLVGACGSKAGHETSVSSEGARVYARLCVNCHRAEGRGAVGEVPPLVRHFPEVLNAGGRRYVIRAVLYGLEGSIDAGGKKYSGLMTPMSYMKDEELAAVLNHVARSWDNAAELPKDFADFTALEIAVERVTRFLPREVRAQRPASLDLLKGQS
jgi:mono/diheme cytochrome c family protein